MKRHRKPLKKRLTQSFELLAQNSGRKPENFITALNGFLNSVVGTAEDQNQSFMVQFGEF